MLFECSLSILGRRINLHHNFLLFKHKCLHVHEELLQLRELHGGVGVSDAVLDLLRHHRLLLPQLDEGLCQWNHLQYLGVNNLPALHKCVVNLNSLNKNVSVFHVYIFIF